ncbi:MAG: SDR family oxidoreductase [Chloroflexi bacterium]|nr:SDR family oxidoreductase [Chloroflexota bacterium]
MRVLLTGHRGYIGTVMTPMLLDAGHEVVGLDTELYETCTFGDGQDIVDVPSIRKDIRDVTAEDLAGYEAVIHLAALSNDPLGDLNPSLTDEINHAASVRLARLAKEAGVERFIFSSSCSNYGAAGEDWLTENSPLNPVTPYGESKVAVEQAVSALADEAFCPTFPRSGTAYGVSPRLRFDLVLNNLTAWAYTTGQVFLKSDGRALRPIVHIEDISRAFLAILHAPKDVVRNGVFNIGTTTENYRVSELAEIVASVVPGSRIEYADGAGPDKRNYRVDCNRLARTLPDYKPQWTARRGAEELYEAFQRIGITVDDFEGPRFKRIAHVKLLMEEGRLTDRLRWTKAQEVAGAASRASE